MNIKTPRSIYHAKLRAQREKVALAEAELLRLEIEQKAQRNVNLVFPAYIYSQILKSVR